MIKINLLPIRASKKKETIRQQVSILALSVSGVLIVGLSLYAMEVKRVAAAKAQIETSEAEIRALKSKIGAIDNIKKLQAEVKKKLDVLNQLRREKSGPVSRLAALSDALPEKLWLTKYSENGTKVDISGVAVTEEHIAAFMRDLQRSGAFDRVDLLVSEQIDVGGVKAKRFDLTMQIAGGPAAPAANEKRP